jgi:hypothetical protein
MHEPRISCTLLLPEGPPPGPVTSHSPTQKSSCRALGSEAHGVELRCIMASADW